MVDRRLDVCPKKSMSLGSNRAACYDNVDIMTSLNGLFSQLDNGVCIRSSFQVQKGLRICPLH